MKSIVKRNITIFVCLLICILPCAAEYSTHPPSVPTDSNQKKNTIFKQLWNITDIIGYVIPMTRDPNEPVETLPRKIRHAVTDGQVELLTLPDDQTRRLYVREIRVTGNTLISTETILAELPLVFNASGLPLAQAQSQDLYDLRKIQDIITGTNQPVEVTLRTIQGLTQYVLSLYQDSHYSGIYVFVPKGAIRQNAELVDGILPINVIEATVSGVTTKYFDVERNEVEKGILRRSALESWLPVKEGEVARQKRIDNILNLLNLNPDRYVNALVSPGSEPNTLEVQYNVYETSPWHYFVQVDNSGTDDRQWNPRLGVINSNLLGFDDRLTVIGQAIPDSTLDENYSLFGSYDFPVVGPRLRLNLYGGYSKFDINPGTGPFDFLGRGSFYGGVLRYNVLQHKGWFIDVTGSLSQEESKIKPSLFPQFLSSHVRMDLLGFGINLHRRDDMSSTSLGLNRVESIGGSSQDQFWDYVNLTGTRTNAERDFIIYTASASHNQYLDQRKVQQVRGTVRWIRPNARLTPAKMTSFGGMHSVRGYDEYEIVADGGVLASIQYEFDLVKHSEAIEGATIGEMELKKLAPLLFIDYGRTKIEDRVLGEKRNRTLYSVGTGLIVELGDNFSGAIYYGCPIKDTDETYRGNGRINISLMMRW